MKSDAGLFKLSFLAQNGELTGSRCLRSEPRVLPSYQIEDRDIAGARTMRARPKNIVSLRTKHFDHRLGKLFVREEAHGRTAAQEVLSYEAAGTGYALYSCASNSHTRDTREYLRGSSPDSPK